MRSIRKISLLAAVVAVAISVAAPAAASAAVIEAPAGQKMPVGAKFTMSSFDSSFLTSWGKLRCGEMTLPGELTQNNGTVKVKGGLGSAGYCEIATTPPKAFTVEPELRGLTLNSPQSGTVDLKFNVKYPPTISCVYERTDIPVTYTAGSSKFLIANASMKAIPAGCGPFVLTANFSLSSLLGTPVLN